jgi:hypothetical protein
VPVYAQIPDTPGTDLIQAADPTGNNQDTQQVVLRDEAGVADDSGVYVGVHGGPTGLRRILLASRPASGWERDANGRVVVVEL